jgi:hypothetical protein
VLCAAACMCSSTFQINHAVRGEGMPVSCVTAEGPVLKVC